MQQSKILKVLLFVSIYMSSCFGALLLPKQTITRVKNNIEILLAVTNLEILQSFEYQKEVSDFGVQVLPLYQLFELKIQLEILFVLARVPWQQDWMQKRYIDELIKHLKVSVDSLSILDFIIACNIFDFLQDLLVIQHSDLFIAYQKYLQENIFLYFGCLDKELVGRLSTQVHKYEVHTYRQDQFGRFIVT